MGWPNDTLTGIYLGLFAFGGIFSVISLLLGAVGGHFHLPGAVHAGHAPHVGHHGHGDSHGAHAAPVAVGPGAAPGPLNLSTVMIFLTWFGATGYLLHTYTTEAAELITLVAIGVGLLGALIVWLALAKVLWRGQTQLEPQNYAITGVAARISAPIRPGGTGEIVYTLDGKRQVDAARAEPGVALPRGTEVAILRRAGGIAWVVPVDDINTDDPFQALEEGAGTATGAREGTR